MKKILRRGFKSWAEEQAIIERQVLGLRAESALQAAKLAEKYNVTIIGPAQIPGIPVSCLQQLLKADNSSWSAFTLVSNGRTVIIKNTSHILSRQEGDVMHEISHLICKH